MANEPKELIELFFTGEVGTSRENFKEKFQCLLNRTPRAHSTIKQEFFTYFFLGSVLTLPYTGLKEKIGIQDIYVKNVSNETMKLVFKIEKDQKKQLVFKTITTVRRVGNSQHMKESELKEILETLNLDQNKLDGYEIKGEIIQIRDGKTLKIEELKTVEQESLDVKLKEISKNGPPAGNSEGRKEFKKIKDDMIQGDLDNIVEKFSDIKTAKGSAKGFFQNLVQIYGPEKASNTDSTENKAKKLNLVNTEAAHHAFTYGALAMNFKYRYVLDIAVERIASKGWLDLIFISRYDKDQNKKWDAPPFCVEFKKVEETKGAISQVNSKGYIKIQPGIRTLSQRGIIVGVNFNSGSDKGVLLEESQVMHKPKGLSDLFKELSTLSREKLQEKLNYLYFSIVKSNGGGRNTNYLSRLILGELLADNTLKKYVFVHNDNNMEMSTFVLKMQDGKYVILNVIEGKDFEVKNGIPLDKLGVNLSKCTQVNIRVNPEAKGGFEVDRKEESYYQDIEIADTVAAYTNNYKGEFKEIKHVEILKVKEEQLQVERLKGPLFCLKKLIIQESDLQAILQGLLTAQENIIVHPESNHSGAGNADFVVLYVQEGRVVYVTIMELKHAGVLKDANQKLLEGEDQINKYLTNLKTFTDERKAEAIVLVFDADAGSADKLLLVKQKKDVAIDHSSQDEVSHEQLSQSLGKTPEHPVDKQQFNGMSSYGSPTGPREQEGTFLSPKADPSSYQPNKMDTPDRGYIASQSSDSDNSPQCKRRRKQRSVYMLCIDSHDKEDITKEKKEQRIKELFGDDKILVKEDTDVYVQIFKAAQRVPEIDLHIEEDTIIKLKSMFFSNSETEHSDTRDNIKIFKELSNYLNSISTKLDNHFLQMCKVNSLKIISPIIEDENFKVLLENNWGGLYIGGDSLSFLYSTFIDDLFKEIGNKLSENQLQYEDPKNKINQEVFNTVCKNKISEIIAKSKEEGNVNQSNYLVESIKLSQTLSLIDRLLPSNQREVHEALKKLIYYNTLVNLGMLIDKHIQKSNQDDLTLLRSRISVSQVSIVYGLYSFRNDIDYNKLSYSSIEDYFLNNIEDFNTEIQAYNKVAFKDHFQKNPIAIEEIKKQINYISLDKKDLQIKLKVNNKDYLTITGEKNGDYTKFYLGGAVEFDSITQFLTDTNKKAIYDHLHELSNTKELLENKRNIENIADTQDLDKGHSDIIMNEIEQTFLKKGMSKSDFDRLKDRLSNINEEVFREFIDETSKRLEEKGISFDQKKFDLAKEKSHKHGKWFSLMAIYDLCDSIQDATTLGRYDNDVLKQVFGINGILDSMNDVRNSITLSHGSKIGGLVNKIPQSLRQSFIKIIDNPVVSTITFVTIAYQFGYSLNEIMQGNHNPLNYYWVASSGTKLASMGIEPISIGVNYAVRSISISAKVLRLLSVASEVLSVASTAFMFADFAIIIGTEAYERMEYLQAINELEEITRINNYLSNEGKVAVVRSFNNDPDVAAVVWYINSIQENYSEIIKAPFHRFVCNIEPNENIPDKCFQPYKYKYDDIIHFDEVDGNKDLSSLNISNTLPMMPYVLTSENWGAFKCSVRKNYLGFLDFPSAGLKGTKDFFDCKKGIVENRTVYIVSMDAKHIPHVNKDEYNQLGLRIVRAPLEKQEGVGKGMQCNNEIINEYKEDGSNTDKVHTYCSKTYTFSSDEPLIFANVSRLNSNKDKIVYRSGPHSLTAAKDYSAFMYVTSGNDIHYIGSENHRTDFIVSGPINGTLKGGMVRNNTIVFAEIVDFKSPISKEITVDLYNGTVRCGNENIKLTSIYDFVSYFNGTYDIYTHCNTTFISAKNAKVRQGSSSCQDQDYEVRVVKEGNTHLRGLKQTTFIINENSDNFSIVNNFNRMNRFKRNVDIIEVTDIGQLKVTENTKESGYILNILGNTGTSIISSIKVDNFENLVIKQKHNDYLEGYVTVQGSKQKSNAAIQVKISNQISGYAYTLAKDIASRINLGIPLSQIEVIQNMVAKNVACHKAIINSVRSGQIAVNFNYGSQSNGNAIAYNYCQNIDVEGGSRYIVKLPELDDILKREASLEITKFHLNMKNYVSSGPIRLTISDRMDTSSVNITKGSRDNIVIEITTIPNNKYIRKSLSIDLEGYFMSPERRVILQINNKFYGVNDANFKLERLEKVNFKYYKPGENGLQIYHNQPVNMGKVGVVDLQDKSVFDCDMRIDNSSLLIQYKSKTFVEIKNWNAGQSARKMRIIFADAMVHNSKCIDSTCDPQDIIEEFYILKTQNRLATQLFGAAEENVVLTNMRTLIRSLGSPNVKNKDGNTLLYVAVLHLRVNNLSLIDLLIEEGVDPDEKDPLGNAVLHKAVLLHLPDLVKLLVDKGDADITARNDAGQTPLEVLLEALRKSKVLFWSIGSRKIVDFLTKKSKEQGKPSPRMRRNIPEMATGSAGHKSSLVSYLLNWAGNFTGKLFNPRAIESGSSTPNLPNISQVDASIDVNGTIVLLDLFIKKVTGQKYTSLEDHSISELEARGYALSITAEFEKVLKDTAKRSGISVNESFDSLEVYGAIEGKIMSGELSKIPTILYSSAKEAYPENEKFLSILKSNIEEMLDEQKIGNNRHSNNQVQNMVSTNDKPLSSLSDVAIEPANNKSLKGITSAG